jgi:hypothetical protein
MMNAERNYLQSLLAGESRAYGFTIAFWGSGAMLINTHGVPGIERALLYGLGAVTGFGILAIAAFGNSGKKVEYENPGYIVLGMVHYIAALIPIYLSYMINLASLTPAWKFFLSGMAVSTVYNILAVLEEDIVEFPEKLSPL